jgi:hypothetical protein
MRLMPVCGRLGALAVAGVAEAELGEAELGEAELGEAELGEAGALLEPEFALPVAPVLAPEGAGDDPEPAPLPWD